MAFDKDKPAASTSLRSSNPEILANQSQLQTAINNEHIFSGTASGTQTGDHTQGSARCYSQSSAPTTRIDGSGFLSTDLGSLWVDTDDNAIYILTATTPTWTPVSTEIIATLLAAARVFGSTLGVTGDFAVNTNKFTVAGATGNTVIAGTLSVTGVAIIGDLSRLATSAAPLTPSMIANKKYVDDQITANAVNSNGLAKAWVQHAADGTIAGSGYNITSTVKTATGRYTVTWDTDFADANYAISITCVQPNDTTGVYASLKTVAAGSITYVCRNRNDADTDVVCHVTAMGTQ